MFRRNAREMRVLILAPVGRDASLLASTLTPQAEVAIAANVSGLLQMLADGVGVAIVAEEALNENAIASLGEWVAQQPPWSDTPFITLTWSGMPTRESHQKAKDLEQLGNIVLIERPVRPDTIVSSVRTALRARMRQYEIRSRQEALIQANADLEQFAHAASHDLREPLRTISIYSELLSREYASKLDERGSEFLTYIHSAAVRMNSLLHDLLAYSHASSIAEEDFEPISASRPLEAAMENLAAAIRESEATITIGELPKVKIRESHLSQIFQNLIGNAIKYQNENTRPMIDLSVHENNGRWVFTVADNGIGVPPAYKESIFGIFKRLHTASKYSGTGMGLAICKRIVERYRGTIWVESEPGKGSRFHFSLPR